MKRTPQKGFTPPRVSKKFNDIHKPLMPGRVVVNPCRRPLALETAVRDPGRCKSTDCGFRGLAERAR